MPLPDKIKNAPKLFLGSEFYYNAFYDLHSTRQYGLSIGPIPWTAINDYAIRYGIYGFSFEILVSVLREVDRQFVIWQSTKASKASP